jgi:hypothetical protein
VYTRPPALFSLVAPLTALLACGGGTPPAPAPLPKYQSVCAEGVAIYPSAKALASNYHEIALLKATGDSADQSTLAAAQRKQAAELGANGIITGKLKHPKSGVQVMGSTLGSSAQRKASALAIYVPADSERVRRACGYPRAQLANWTEHSSTLVRAGSPLLDSMDSTRPYNVAPALDEAALGRNPNLRWAMATARRVGIATGFFEGHPGILKVTVTESFRSAPALEYTLAELWEAYSEHRPYDEPGVIELWEGDAKVGEYRQSGFSRMTP